MWPRVPLKGSGYGIKRRNCVFSTRRSICLAFFLCIPLIPSKGALKTSKNFYVLLVYHECPSLKQYYDLSMARIGTCHLQKWFLMQVKMYQLQPKWGALEAEWHSDSSVFQESFYFSLTTIINHFRTMWSPDIFTILDLTKRKVLMSWNAFSCRVALFLQSTANTGLTSPQAEWGLTFFFLIHQRKVRW